MFRIFGFMWDGENYIKVFGDIPYQEAYAVLQKLIEADKNALEDTKIMEEFKKFKESTKNAS